MNYWKYIVFALLGGMVLFHLGAVWLIWGKHYELTSPDYYAKEMAYQTTLDRLRRGKAFDWRYAFDRAGGVFTLQVNDGAGRPADLAAVALHLYRPNDAGKDLRVELTAVDGGGYRAYLPNLASGRWHMTLESQHGGQDLAYQSALAL